MSSNFISKFKTKHSPKIGEENVSWIEKSSLSILQKIRKQFKEGQNPTGIIYGKIQSGKTLNFLSLVSCAFDEDWNICIILNSNNIFIAKQNKKRVEEFFREDERIKKFYLGKESRNELESENGEALYNWVRQGRKLIIIVPKNSSWMKKTCQFINDNKALFFDSKSKTLIIDDEGDQSSLNNNALKENKSPTTINDLINQIRKSLPPHAYLSVTATPFANIVGTHMKEMSPNFIECVYPGHPYQGTKYYGIEEIWEKGSEIKRRTVRIIEKKDVEILWKSENDSFPSSLENALSTFFVATALLRKDKDLFGYEMIINPNIRLAEQKLVSKKVENFLANLKKSLETNDYLANFIKRGLEILRNVDKKTPNDLDEKVKREVICCKIEEMNSESEVNKSEGLTLTNKIYIGSISIGRGLSFERLIVTYLTSRGKGTQNADTALQKSRWDGYKKEEMFQLTRVWCTEEINEDYQWIRECQINLWKEMEKQKDLPNWKRIFILGKKQRLTRPSIAQQKRTKRKEIYLQYLPSEDSKEENKIYHEVVSGLHGFRPSDSLWDDEKHREKEFTNLSSFYQLVSRETLFYILSKKILIDDKTVQQILQKITEFQTKFKFIILVILSEKLLIINQIHFCLHY